MIDSIVLISDDLSISHKSTNQEDKREKCFFHGIDCLVVVIIVIVSVYFAKILFLFGMEILIIVFFIGIMYFFIVKYSLLGLY